MASFMSRWCSMARRLAHRVVKRKWCSWLRWRFTGLPPQDLPEQAARRCTPTGVPCSSPRQETRKPVYSGKCFAQVEQQGVLGAEVSRDSKGLDRPSPGEQCAALAALRQYGL